MKSNDKIIKFHKQIQINVGLIIFGIIFIYVLFHVFSYITADNITVYEVKEGTIAQNYTYQALAIRQEQVVNAETDGAIFYYASNLDQVGVKSNIYSIDHSGEITKQLKSHTQEDTAISDHDMTRLQKQIGDFVYDYNNNKFQKVYTFKSDLSSNLQQYYSNSLMTEIAPQIEQATQQGKFAIYTAPTSGIVVYQTDGYEGLTLDQVTSESFDMGNLNVSNLKTQESVEAGKPVYKLIVSDDWDLIMPIDEALVSMIQEEEMQYIQIRFETDNATTWASCEVIEKAGEPYLVLHLDDSVARYGDARFVPIELLIHEETGLKIPNSAIVKKEFFTVPKSYFFMGNDSDSSGLMVQSKKQDAQFVTPTIYYETDDAYYIDADDIAKNTVILKPNSQETYTVGADTATLQGVYNINKGYAVFKQINILYQNEDYAIISTGTTYGLALYDHIVLQGDLVKENQVIR